MGYPALPPDAAACFQAVAGIRAALREAHLGEANTPEALVKVVKEAIAGADDAKKLATQATTLKQLAAAKAAAEALGSIALAGLAVQD